jgi:ornithine cyclodeaminase/alanine dehydrogenase-like protein (mu-crystallin family)
VIDAVEAGFFALARGDVNAPERLRLDLPERNGILLAMPAYAGLDGAGALGTKIVSVFEQNAEFDLDVIQAIYLLLDSATGVPLALMEGRFITAIRTAAASAVATRFMAGSGSKRLAVFGAGVQAEAHISAMIEVAQIERVMIASRSAEKAHALADRIGSLHDLPCEVVSVEEAASTANLICACTSSSVPVFAGALLKPGTHINAVGAFAPATRELDTETVRNARVIIDAESAAGREAGEILIPISEGAIAADHVKGTLGEVVSGSVAGREAPAEITLFKSCGLAIEDLVTANLAYSRAKAAGIGERVEL